MNVADLAAYCEVSPRALQLGFQRHVGMSPMTYLRDVRLRRADAELRVAAPDDTVAGVAHRWGFAHLGRFAASDKALRPAAGPDSARRPLMRLAASGASFSGQPTGN